MSGYTSEPIGKHCAPAHASTATSQATAAMSPVRISGVVSGAAEATKAKKNKINTRTVVKVLLIVLGVLAAVYVAGIIVFSNLFLPRTAFAGNNISFKSAADVSSIATQIGTDYKVKVSGHGLDFTVTSADAGVTVDGSTVANKALSSQRAWAWPYEVFKTHDMSSFLFSEYNESGLADVVGQKVDTFNETAEPPVNASVAFSSAKDAFEVKSEQTGTQVDTQAVLSEIDKAILNMDSAVTLDDTVLVQPTVLSNDPSLIAAADEANGYLKARIELVLGSTAIHAADVGPAEISQWVTVDDEGNVSFDQDAMNSWTRDLAFSINTVGSERSYKTANGDTITVSGGTYGWKVDADKLVSTVQEAVQEGENGQVTVPTKSEGYTWAGQGKADWGAHAEVSISQQHAWFFDESGNMVWESDVVTGKPGHDTSPGVWKIFKQQSPGTLTGSILPSTGKPEYVTKVSYWMQFTYDGQGFHDATWQSSFGGSRYTSGYGSHGCVNLPLDKAKELYSHIAIGNAVIVYN